MCRQFVRKGWVVTLGELPTIIRRADVPALGLTTYRFYALCKAGEYEQIAPGIYLRPGSMDDTTAALAAITLRKPQATICLVSALSLHDLTDEIPRATEIALPRGERTLATKFAPIRWHSFDRGTFLLGRETKMLNDGVEIGLYGPERSIIDAFRLRHDLGADLAHEGLKRWMRHRASSPNDLLTMAAHFPKARPALQTALEILL